MRAFTILHACSECIIVKFVPTPVGWVKSIALNFSRSSSNVLYFLKSCLKFFSNFGERLKFFILSDGGLFRTVKNVLIFQRFSISGSDPWGIQMRQGGNLRSSHVSKPGNLPINVNQLLRRERRQINGFVWIYEIFGLFVFVEFALYLLHLSFLFQTLNKFGKHHGSGTIMIFDIFCPNQLLLKLFVIVKINEIQ